MSRASMADVRILSSALRELAARYDDIELTRNDSGDTLWRVADADELEFRLRYRSTLITRARISGKSIASYPRDVVAELAKSLDRQTALLRGEVLRELLKQERDISLVYGDSSHDIYERCEWLSVRLMEMAQAARSRASK